MRMKINTARDIKVATHSEKTFQTLFRGLQGSSSADSEFREKSLEVFDLLEAMHMQLTCRRGNTFLEFDLVSSITNHNHEEIIDNIETYQCVAIKSL